LNELAKHSAAPISPMSSKPSIDTLVRDLVAANLDPEKSRAFAIEIAREASRYKPTGVSSARMRRELLEIARSFTAAAIAVDRSRDSDFHQDTASHLSAWGVGSPPLNIRVSKTGAWDATIKKYWPHLDRVPPLAAVREYLSVYAAIALQNATHFSAARRGAPDDFERYRPVLYCVRAWRNSFGTNPGKGITSPFVRACRVALPLFGMQVPSKLHTFVQRALRGIDIDRLT
jgi:hypothetical protein